MDPCPLSGAYPEKVLTFLISFRQSGKGLTDLFLCKCIPLVQHQDTWYVFLPYSFQKSLILPADPGLSVYDQYCRVGLIQHLIAFLYPETAQFTFIINTRRIHHHYRPQRQQLHRLIHRICGSSLNIRYHCQILACDFVHHTGFSCVSLSEKADMYPL